MNVTKVIIGLSLTVSAAGAGVAAYYAYQEYKVQKQKTKDAQQGFDEQRQQAERDYEAALATHKEELAKTEAKRKEDLEHHLKVMAELELSAAKQKALAKQRDELITKFENSEITVEELNTALQATYRESLDDIETIIDLRKQSTE